MSEVTRAAYSFEYKYEFMNKSQYFCCLHYALLNSLKSNSEKKKNVRSEIMQK